MLPKKVWPVLPLIEITCPKCNQIIKGTAKKINSEVVWFCGCDTGCRGKKTKKILDKT